MTVKNNNTRRKYENAMPVPDEGWWESVLAEERLHAPARSSQLVTKPKPAPQEKLQPVQVIEPVQLNWDEIKEIYSADRIVSMKVTGHNRGGILVRWNRLEGFIPSSHLVSMNLSGERRDAWDELRDQVLVVKVIEVDQDRRRLIFSEREAQKEWRAQQKARLLAELKEGDRVKGTVTGLRDFGAFVNLGGAEALLAAE